MLGVLLKKEIAEVFRNFFFDRRKNKPRSKTLVILMFVIFSFLLFGMLGGSFAGMALSICGELTEAGMDWLYFDVMSGTAIVLGIFGSVFNTYSTLYLPNDNELLFSMPIPVKTIIAARLLKVYLLNIMYSGIAILPAIIVYWCVKGITPLNAAGGIMMIFIITVTVHIFTCVFGWIAAKISLKVKNKSFISVILTIAIIAAYYFFCFNTSEWVSYLTHNVEAVGNSIKNNAYILYLFGTIGSGDMLSAGLFIIINGILLALVLYVLVKTFFTIATSSGKSEKKRYTEKKARERSAFAAMLGKELSRFFSSTNYMLNCGFGIILIPAGGIILLIKGQELFDVLSESLPGMNGLIPVLLCSSIMALASMNDMAAPSVSLEGKNIWIPQSMPAAPETVLLAKAALQFVLTVIPILIAEICALTVMPCTVTEKLMFFIVPLVYTVFSAFFFTFLSIRFPTLEWTSEIIPIKQSLCIFISLFGSWGISLLFLIMYFLAGHLLGTEIYLAVWAVIYAAASVFLWHYLKTKGAKDFSRL